MANKEITVKCIDCGDTWETTQRLGEYECCAPCDSYFSIEEENVMTHNKSIGLRAGEDARLIATGKVQFSVDKEIFGDDLQALGVRSSVFVATVEGNHFTKVYVQQVVHKATGKDVTAYFDLDEMLEDFAFAVRTNPDRYYELEAKEDGV